MRAATASCTLPVPRSGRLERCPGLWQCLGAVRGRAGRQGPFPAIRLMPLRPSRHFWRLTNLPLLAARSILSPAFGPLSRPAATMDAHTKCPPATVAIQVVMPREYAIV